jgi:hypothetical protein
MMVICMCVLQGEPHQVLLSQDCNVAETCVWFQRKSYTAMQLLMHAVTSFQQYIIARSISNGATSLKDAKELQVPWLMINMLIVQQLVFCPNPPPAVSLECQADVLLAAAGAAPSSCFVLTMTVCIARHLPAG